jgi:predicted MFS family arabinose efflux permease
MAAPNGWRRVALLLFVIGWGANHFGALLLVYRAKLHLDPAAPQLLFGIYALGLVPGLLLSGPLSDRFGRRTLVLPAAVICFVASAILGVGGDRFALLLCGRLLYGVGCGAVMNPGAVWVLELSHDALGGSGARRATIALSSGFGFGPLISGLLAQYAPYPTLLPYLLHLATLIVAIVVCAAAPGGRKTEGPQRPLLGVGLDRTNRRGFLLGVATMAPFVFAFPVIVFTVLPVMLGPGALGSAPIAYIGLLAAVTLGTGVLAQPVTRRFDPTLSSRIGLLFGTLGCLLGAFVVSARAPGLLLLVAPVLGIGYGVCMTSGLRNVELLAKAEARGGMTGLYYVLTYIGFAVPYIVAQLTRTVDPTSALIGIAVLSALAALVLRRPRLIR